MDTRDGFKAIADGWMLVDDFDELTDRIERLGEWTKVNGPLLPDEESTVRLMIESQIAKGIARGDFEPFIPAKGPKLLDEIKRMMSSYAAMYGKVADGLFVPANRADELVGLAQFLAAAQGHLACDLTGNLSDGLVIDSLLGLRVRLCTGDKVGVGALLVTGDTPRQMAIWVGDPEDGR